MKKMWQRIQSWDTQRKKIFIFGALFVLAVPFLLFIWSNFQKNLKGLDNVKILKKLELPPAGEADEKMFEKLLQEEEKIEKELAALEQEETETTSSDGLVHGEYQSTSSLTTSSEATSSSE